jgi:hypothetical protein
VKKQRIAKSTKFGGCVENRRDKETFEDADTQGQERDYGSRCSMTAAAIKICMKLLVYLRDCIGLYLLKRNL